MNEDEFIRPKSGGVCASDRLPLTIGDRPKIYIVNTEPVNTRGTHWVTFYFPRKERPEFFDSAGHAPEFYDSRFQNVLINNGGTYLISTSRIQPSTTDTCGAFCLFYAAYRCRGWTMHDILRLFRGTSLMDNDNMVVDFGNRFLGESSVQEDRLIRSCPYKSDELPF
jgi:hypothetical protein